jgi:hypothetical protein
MNAPTKFDPCSRIDPLCLFPPGFRSDTFRDLGDVALHMCLTDACSPNPASGFMIVNEWLLCIMRHDDSSDAES